MILLDYYNTMYERHYEKWWIMTFVERKDELMKEIMTIEKAKQIMHQN